MSHVKFRSWFKLLPAAAALTTTLVGLQGTARADAASCTNLHASGQREVKAGRLKLASELFTSCGSDETCPAAVRADCMERFAAVEKNIPTVIFSLTDQDGQDVTNVKVYSNEDVVAEGLDGRPVALEPGRHRFRFVLPSGQVTNLDVLVREAEKNRVINVELVDKTKPVPAAAAPTPAPVPQAPPPAEQSSSLSPGFWIASGIGAAALGSWATFALLGREKNVSLADCSPDCDSSRRDDYKAMKRDYLIADISLGAAAVSVGAATYFLLSSGSNDAPSKGPDRAWLRSTKIAVVPARSGATLMFSGDAF